MQKIEIAFGLIWQYRNLLLYEDNPLKKIYFVFHLHSEWVQLTFGTSFFISNVRFLYDTAKSFPKEILQRHSIFSTKANMQKYFSTAHWRNFLNSLQVHMPNYVSLYIRPWRMYPFGVCTYPRGWGILASG